MEGLPFVITDETGWTALCHNGLFDFTFSFVFDGVTPSQA